MGPLRAERLALNLLVGALLAGCASGGGGGYSPSPPSPPPPMQITPGPPPVAPPPAPPLAPPGSVPDTSSAEFTNNWGVGGVGAQHAWAYEGGTGAGVTVAVIDDGVDPDHPELAGRISPDSASVAPGLPLTSSQTHGSELSSLIAGNFNGAQTMGVAYEATILAVRADNGSGSFNEQYLADAVDYAVAHGADIINFSLGSPYPSTDAFRDALQRATEAGVIVVASAGNDGGFSSQVNYPGYFANDPDVSNGLIIVAGGLNSDGSVNTRSNPPGSARNFYLVAPGWEIIVPDFGPFGPLPNYQVCWPDPNNCSGLVRIQGTSYASPLTAAAAAVLWSAFPGLEPDEVVALLLSTTDDIGAPGVDGLSGRGRLNLARAFAPVGQLSSPLTSGLSVTSGLALGAVGGAFGDGLSNDAGEWVVAAFDAYDRTYKLDLARNWTAPRGGPALGVHAPLLWQSARDGEAGVSMQFAAAEEGAPDSLRLAIARADIERPAMRIERQLAAGFALGLATEGAGAGETDARGWLGHMGFVHSDLSLRLSRRMTEHVTLAVTSERGAARVGLDQQWSERRGAAFEAAYAAGPFALAATFGRIDEERGLLGLVWRDALGAMPGAEARFAGLSGHVDVSPRLRLRAGAETGAADLAHAGWLALEAPLRTSAFNAELLYALAPAWIEGARGQVSLTVTQPLRVEAGAFTALLPSATAYGRDTLSYVERRIDVAPSGRELQFGLGYRAFLGERLAAYAEAVVAREPGHAAGADEAGLVRLGLRARY